MSDGGKGSSPRPYSVSQNEFANNWDRIFKKDKTVVDKKEYSDILTTEESLLRSNDETKEALTKISR
jgi:hypothetical protein